MTAKNLIFDQTNLHPNYESQITEIILSNLTPKHIGDRMKDFHENDVAAAMDMLKREDRAKLCSVLSDQRLADVLAYSENAHEYIGELSIRRRTAILSCMEPTQAAEYLQTLEKRERDVLLELMDDSVRREITLINSFDEDEIGRRMTTNYIVVYAGISVRQAMRELVAQAADNDNISTIYVVDQDETLMGAIDLKDLIIAREDTPLEDITMASYPYVYAEEQIAECIERLKDYSENSFPVLDSCNRLIGVLTAQDVTNLVDDEMGEDYAKLAGLTSEADIREPLKKSVVKRLPWLVVLLGLGLLVSSVVGLFEEVVASLTLVVCFQSLILDMAGNVGTQSLAITIRVLMDEHLTGRQKVHLTLKEARVGLCNGVILGILSFGMIGLYLMWKGETALLAFSISACTGIALLVSMVLSSISGTTIPLLFKRMNIDPAVASGPLITTINDLVAVITYYGLAWMLLIRMMHLA